MQPRERLASRRRRAMFGPGKRTVQDHVRYRVDEMAEEGVPNPTYSPTWWGCIAAMIPVSAWPIIMLSIACFFPVPPPVKYEFQWQPLVLWTVMTLTFTRIQKDHIEIFLRVSVPKIQYALFTVFSLALIVGFQLLGLFPSLWLSIIFMSVLPVNDVISFLLLPKAVRVEKNITPKVIATCSVISNILCTPVIMSFVFMFLWTLAKNQPLLQLLSLVGFHATKVFQNAVVIPRLTFRYTSDIHDRAKFFTVLYAEMFLLLLFPEVDSTAQFVAMLALDAVMVWANVLLLLRRNKLGCFRSASASASAVIPVRPTADPAPGKQGEEEKEKETAAVEAAEQGQGQGKGQQAEAGEQEGERPVCATPFSVAESRLLQLILKFVMEVTSAIIIALFLLAARYGPNTAFFPYSPSALSDTAFFRALVFIAVNLVFQSAHAAAVHAFFWHAHEVHLARVMVDYANRALCLVASSCAGIMCLFLVMQHLAVGAVIREG